jgi:two-component system response regulator YesN
MLEEFVVRHGAEPDPALFRPTGLEEGDPAMIFDRIGDVFERAINSVQESTRRRDHLDLDEVREHIDSYYQDPLSLQSVANLFLVSKEHLSRAFRKAFGETVNEYISRRRMETARELIVRDGMDIKQVAYLTGYQDLAYFYRVFKKQFGVPPGQVRE